MTQTPEPQLRSGGLNGRSAARPTRPGPSAWSVASTTPVEIFVPEADHLATLLQYAAPVFPAERVAGPSSVVRLQPPAGAAWVLELLSLVDRWLESTGLACVRVLYGGRTYLLSSSGAAAWIAAADAPDRRLDR